MDRSANNPGRPTLRRMQSLEVASIMNEGMAFSSYFSHEADSVSAPQPPTLRRAVSAPVSQTLAEPSSTQESKASSAGLRLFRQASASPGHSFTCDLPGCTEKSTRSTQLRSFCESHFVSPEIRQRYSRDLFTSGISRHRGTSLSRVGEEGESESKAEAANPAPEGDAGQLGSKSEEGYVAATGAESEAAAAATAAAAAAVVGGPWQCIGCTVENPEPADACFLCATPAPPAHRPAAAPAPTAPAAEQERSGGYAGYGYGGGYGGNSGYGGRGGSTYGGGGYGGGGGSEWQCGACTMRNAGWRQQCSVCRSVQRQPLPQPETTQQQPQQQAEQAAEAEAEAEAAAAAAAAAAAPVAAVTVAPPAPMQEQVQQVGVSDNIALHLIALTGDSKEERVNAAAALIRCVRSNKREKVMVACGGGAAPLAAMCGSEDLEEVSMAVSLLASISSEPEAHATLWANGFLELSAAVVRRQGMGFNAVDRATSLFFNVAYTREARPEAAVHPVSIPHIQRMVELASGNAFTAHRRSTLMYMAAKTLSLLSSCPQPQPRLALARSPVVRAMVTDTFAPHAEERVRMRAARILRNLSGVIRPHAAAEPAVGAWITDETQRLLVALGGLRDTRETCCHALDALWGRGTASRLLPSPARAAAAAEAAAAEAAAAARRRDGGGGGGGRPSWNREQSNGDGTNRRKGGGGGGWRRGEGSGGGGWRRGGGDDDRGATERAPRVARDNLAAAAAAREGSGSSGGYGYGYGDRSQRRQKGREEAGPQVPATLRLLVAAATADVAAANVALAQKADASATLQASGFNPNDPSQVLSQDGDGDPYAPRAHAYSNRSSSRSRAAILEQVSPLPPLLVAHPHSTPLHFAVLLRCPALARALLRAGADRAAPDGSGRGAMAVAACTLAVMRRRKPFPAARVASLEKVLRALAPPGVFDGGSAVGRDMNKFIAQRRRARQQLSAETAPAIPDPVAAIAAPAAAAAAAAAPAALAGYGRGGAAALAPTEADDPAMGGGPSRYGGYGYGGYGGGYGGYGQGRFSSGDRGPSRGFPFSSRDRDGGDSDNRAAPTRGQYAARYLAAAAATDREGGGGRRQPVLQRMRS